MRFAAVAVAILVGSVCGTTSVGLVAAAAPASPGSWRYVDAGRVVDWQLARGPRPAVMVGVRALATLASLRSGITAAAVSDGVVVPTSWAHAAMPLGPRGKDIATSLTVGPSERVIWLRTRTTFRVGDEVARLQVLELRTRYRDGLVVLVNGHELARRNMGEGDVVKRVHGPEWEAIYAAPAQAVLVRGDNELVVEVRPHRTRAVPTIDFELTGAETARVVRGPILQRVDATHATIVVETDVPTTAMLHAVAGTQVIDRASPSSTRHVFVLDGLPGGGVVRYSVAIPSAATREATFHTAPDPREPLRLAIYGDVRSGHEVHASLVAAILAWAPDAVLTSGDMVLHGNDEADWQRYFTITADMLATVPVYPALGNHDLAADGMRQLEDIFVLPPPPPGRPPRASWWSTDFSGVHLVALDSNHYDDDNQLTWLDADLAAARARGVRAIIAFTHDGPYSRGIHGGNADARTRYVPVLERHHVELLVSGHDHLYQRGRVGHLTYVVSGGGGAGLYKAACGVTDKPACKVADGMQKLVSEHHWLAVEVHDADMELCARRADATLLEPCVRVPLAKP